MSRFDTENPGTTNAVQQGIRGIVSRAATRNLMPAFVVAFRNKADQSIVQVQVTADSMAEAARIARQKLPDYALVFITPSRDADKPRATGADDGRAQPKRGRRRQRDEAGVDE
ncbi:hypothetical protein ACFFWD_23095 [Bradyrhizobium erythrophlei]|uniref:hypothetical protein n=1 Tax=Bradyrhizobium erythrophlei TaxID=1437360 RepID=UPI0035E5E93B